MDINKLIKEKVKNIGRVNKDVYIVPDIPEKKMKNVKKAFNCESIWKNIIAIYDNTRLGIADEGIVFTGERIIFKFQFSEPIIIFYKDIKEVQYNEKITSNKLGIQQTNKEIIIFTKDNRKITINKNFIGEFNYKEFTNLLNEIINFGNFEETDQLKEIASMSEKLKILYMKILINMAFEHNNEIDKRELAELFLLMTRIKMSKESRYYMREYITNISEENLEKIENLLKKIKNLIENEEKSSYENLLTSLVKDIINLYFATQVTKDNYKNITIQDIEFIQKYRNLFDVSNEKLELILESIKNDYKILFSNINDDEIKKLFKELIAKSAAAGIPLAAIYISGSVVGFSAAGITSGLATLGLGFGMTGGLAIVALIGIFSYKGIKHITGANELEKYRIKEMMLQNDVTRCYKTNTKNYEFYYRRYK